MGALFYKEIRSLWPFAALLVLVNLTSLGVLFATDFLDNQLLDFESEAAADTWIRLAFWAMVFASVVSLGLLVREKDEGTQQFLDALPTTRARVFWAKWLAAFVILSGNEVLSMVEVAVLHWMSTDSVSGAFPWRSFWLAGGLSVFVSAWLLSAGLAVSFFRRWAFLLNGILLWFLYWLNLNHTGIAELVNPFTLLKPRILGDVWIIPWTRLGFLAASGVFLTFLALALYLAPESFLERIISKSKGSWLEGLAKVAAAVMITAVWSGLYLYFELTVGQEAADESDDEDSGRLDALLVEPTGDAAIETLETENFVFSFRRRNRDEVDLVSGRADEIYRQMETFFGGDVPRGEIVVDFSQKVMTHVAGAAHWNKIRMRSLEGEPDSKLVEVFAHELAHVFLMRLGGQRIEEVFSSTRFFHEGVATYVGQRFYGSPESVGRLDGTLAAAHQKHRISLTDLVDNVEFSVKRDANLVYPAGRLFVETLVEVHGDRAIADLVAAFDRDGAPRKLVGMTLWRDLFHATGFNLERVRARFREKLDGLLESNWSWVEALPSVEVGGDGSIRRDGNEVVVTPSSKPSADGEFTWVCRFRASVNVAMFQIVTAHLDEGEFRFDPKNFVEPTFWYQIGVDVEGKTWGAVFDDWVEAELPGR